MKGCHDGRDELSSQEQHLEIDRERSLLPVSGCSRRNKDLKMVILYAARSDW